MRRQFDAAATLLKELAAAEPHRAEIWMQLAIAERALGNFQGELAAVQAVLDRDPYDLLALLAKGQCLERLGREEAALHAYRAACDVTANRDIERLGVDVQRMLNHARGVVERNHRVFSAAFDELVMSLEPTLSGAAKDRFVGAIELLLGRRRRYDSQPMGLYYPQLAPAEFFRRERFPWIPALEARTEAIRTEFLSVLAEDNGFEPYVQYEPGTPLMQWAQLNKSLAWSAFHLLKDGRPVDANARRCPVTMAALGSLPQPHQVGKTPVAMFSCLKPRTRIPPHVGMTNARLVAHLPLIVPDGCGLRVGSQSHVWHEGKVCVFDDSIEHEAWNDSEALRVVLIFDVWHPDLSAEEQQALSALACVQQKLRVTGSG